MRSRASEVLPPSRLRERRRRAWRIKLATLSFLAALLCGSAIAFFYIPALLIRDIRIEGAQTVAAADIERDVRSELAGKRFLVLPKRNAFVYSSVEIEKRLQAAYPKLKEAAVSLENFHTLKVTVAERAPDALQCGPSREEALPCLFLDNTGVAYEQAPEFSDNAYIRWYGGEALALGERFLSEEVFRRLSALVDAFKGEGVEPAAVFVDEVEDVYVFDASGSEIRFALSRKAEDVLKSLRAARASDVLAGKDLSEIEYIDLRFGNRLYYRLR